MKTVIRYLSYHCHTHLRKGMLLAALFLLTLFLLRRTVPSAQASMTIVANDTFQRANQSLWGVASDGQTWGSEANSSTLFSIANTTGKVVGDGSGHTYTGILGPVLKNTEVLLTGYMDTTYRDSNFGAAVRLQDTNNFYKILIGSADNPAFGYAYHQSGTYFFLLKRVGGVYTVLTIMPFTATPGTNYSLRLHIDGAALSAKAWVTGTTEPINWMLTARDNTFTSGYAAVRSLDNNGAVNHITSFTVWDLSAPAPTSTPTPVLYTISGNVFTDSDKDGIRNNGEQNYQGAISIVATGGTVATNNGSFTISGLAPGNYTVSYTSPLNGYTLVSPKNGPPPSFLVTVGPGCSVDTTTGATCSNGNISNLNFAITNSIPWMQLYDLDMRADTGITDTIPANPAPACGPYGNITDSAANTPGTLFTGDISSRFGQGSASTKNWVIGGATYPEVFSPPQGGQLRTSYHMLSALANKAGITPTDLASVNGCSSLDTCTLPANLPNGIYHANGDLTLQAYTFSLKKNYVFLINGNLTIQGSIVVPNGSTVLFSAAQDIQIDKGVHATADTCPAPTGQLQGFFSADRNFIVQGINNCMVDKDTMLNMEGNIITNAAGQGGAFVNNRDLCGDNPTYPSFTLKARPDFLFNAPQFLMPQDTHSEEVAP